MSGTLVKVFCWCWRPARVLIVGPVVVCCTAGVLAAESNGTPWLVISSNRLETVRQAFYALPRPLVEGWQTRDTTGTGMVLRI